MFSGWLRKLLGATTVVFKCIWQLLKNNSQIDIIGYQRNYFHFFILGRTNRVLNGVKIADLSKIFLLVCPKLIYMYAPTLINLGQYDNCFLSPILKLYKITRLQFRNNFQVVMDKRRIEVNFGENTDTEAQFYSLGGYP